MRVVWNELKLAVIGGRIIKNMIKSGVAHLKTIRHKVRKM